LSGRCRKDLGESDVKCFKITESILKSFITDHLDAADKPYGFALLGQLAPRVPLRAAERGRSTGRRMVTISITEEAYEAIKATGGAGDDVRAPRSTGAPSCAFWLDRATIDRLTALKIILLGPIQRRARQC
jgi:hypothetical protein